MQHFEGFDPEGFSLWFCDYKYPEENTVNYIVMNKVAQAALQTLTILQDASSIGSSVREIWGVC